MFSGGLRLRRSAQTRRSVVFTWTALFVLSLGLQYAVFAAPPATTANSTGNRLLGGVEIDGNLLSGNMSPSGDDWAKGTTGNGLLTAPTIIDPIGNADTTTFTQGSKENDPPLSWTGGGNGTASPKDDMGNIYVGSQLLPVPAGPNSHLWAFVGVERASNNGTTFFDFEFNQQPNVTSTDGTMKVPNRTAGDILVVAQQQGTGAFDISATIQRWTGSAWSAPTTPSPTQFYGLSNDAAIPVGPWSDSIASGGSIPQSQFAEMGFDLTSLGLVLACPSGGFGEVNVRTRSSISDSAALKDYASAPVNIPSNCGSLSWTKTDGHSALGGATFKVTPTSPSGTAMCVVDNNVHAPVNCTGTTTSDAAPAVGTLKIADLPPGVYSIQETSPPPGYKLDTHTYSATVGAFQDVVLETSFVDTRKTATTTLVAKSALPPDASSIEPSTPISLAVTETNTGESVLTGVNVTGVNSCAHWTPAANKNGGAGAFSGTLSPGESVDFTCAFTGGSTSFAWSATGRGTDETGTAASLTGETVNGSYVVIHPATTLTVVTPAPDQVHQGDSITILVNERNSGDGAISDVSVSGTNSCATWTPVGTFNGTLAAGASRDFTCTFTAPGSTFTWTADGHGTDMLGNPVPATGEHQSGPVTVVKPSTSLTIVSAPSMVEAGSLATITVNEKNTGNGPISAVSVTGTGCTTWSPVGTFSGTLAAGASKDFSCTFTPTNDPTAWTATGHGKDLLGADVPLTGEQVEGSIDLLHPATTLTAASTNPTTVESGTSVTLKVTEKNTGDTALTGVNVTGTGCSPWSPVGSFSGTLAAGASQDFSCTFTPSANPTAWSATGHGTDPLNNAAPDTNETVNASIIVLHPATTLTAASTNPTTVESGTSVTLKVTEKNTGDTALTGVNVTGTGCSPWSPVGSFSGTLAAGASQDFSCTFTPSANPTAWSATGHGTDPLNNAAPDTNETVNASIIVLHPATTLTAASTNPTTVESGTSVTLKVTEKNTGDTALTGVNVTGTGCSPWSPVGSFSGTLAAGASQDFSCTFTPSANPTAWSATGHGTDPLNNAAPDTNETVNASIIVLHPATTLTAASTNPTTVESGTSVTLKVTEKNTGDTALTGVNVTGTGCSPWSPVGSFSGTLAAGASQDFSCTFTPSANPTAWSATGHGTDPLNNAAPDTNETVNASIIVLHPATTLTAASTNPTTVLTASPITLKVTETNTGDAALSSVSVTGTNSCATWTAAATTTKGAAFSGSLAAGDSVDFTCTFTVGTASFTWTASGHGTDSLGNPVATGPETTEFVQASVHVVNPNIDVVKTAGASLASQAPDGSVYTTARRLHRRLQVRRHDAGPRRPHQRHGRRQRVLEPDGGHERRLQRR